MENKFEPEYKPKIGESERVRRIKEIKKEINENGEKYIRVNLSVCEYYDDYSVTEIGNFLEDEYKDLVFSGMVSTESDNNKMIKSYLFFYK